MKRFHVSKNLFDYTSAAYGITDAFLQSNGNVYTDITSSKDWVITDYIPCNGTAFTLNPIFGVMVAMCLYDENKNYITGTAYYCTQIGSVTITSNTTAKYIRFSWLDMPESENYVDPATIMLNAGSTALPYEPYGNSWNDIPYRRYETATDAVTTLPVTILTDGQPIGANLAWTGWAQDYVTRINDSNKANLQTVDGRNCVWYAASAGYTEYDTKYIFKTNFKESTAYTFSFYGKRDLGANVRIMRAVYTDGTETQTTIVGTGEFELYTFTTSAAKTLKYICPIYSDGSMLIDIDTFMVSEGSTALPYQPYAPTIIKGNMSQSGTPSPSNPITINGVGNKTANLFNPNQTWYAENNYLTTNGDLYANNSFNVSNYIEVEAETEYYMSNCNRTSTYPSIGFYDASKTFISTIRYNGAASISFTTPANCKYILVSVVKLDINIAMLTKGSTAPSDYIPFGYKISISSNQTALSPIYLSNQLMKIGDTVDSLISTGTTTHNIYKWVFDGTENWTVYGSGSSRYFALTAPYACVGSSRDYILTTHFEENRTVVFVTNGTILRVYDTSDWVDETAFKTWLSTQYAAGTPVTVYYVLATAQTETVTAPTIPTTGGTATIDVDTTVKPSEFDLTYHGWHTHEPKKYNNGSWS